jgi:transposase-like protein
MGENKPRPRRSLTDEFKAEIVELCQRGDRSVGQVARDFDLTETAVREWVKQAEREGVRADGGLPVRLLPAASRPTVRTEASDAEQTEQIIDIHTDSKGWEG